MAEEKSTKKLKVGDIVRIKAPLTPEDRKLSYWDVQSPKVMNATVGRVGKVQIYSESYNRKDGTAQHLSIPDLYFVDTGATRKLWFHINVLKKGFKGQWARQEKTDAARKADAVEKKKKKK